jgi:predicted transcriptional regulator of viral defense system
MSIKQRIILRALRSRKQITLEEAIALIGTDIYRNQAKHVGAVLSNMVKRGFLVRVKPGLFELAS